MSVNFKSFLKGVVMGFVVLFGFYLYKYPRSVKVFACGGNGCERNDNEEITVNCVSPTPTTTPIPTATCSPKPTEEPTPTPTIEPTITPTPTPTPTPEPTATPTVIPTLTPTPTSTPQPTSTQMPTSTPGNEPHSGCSLLEANPISGVAPLTVKFNGSGYNDQGDIQMYRFDFGDTSDGQPQIWEQEGSEAYHRYEDEGVYTAMLYVKDSRGVWKTDETVCRVSINVLGEPQVLAITSTKGVLPETGLQTVLSVMLLGTGPAGVFLFRKNKLV